MAISATEQPLGKVFTPDYQFTIPSFQRAYIWKTEHILQLVNDLHEACKTPDTPYFLGSLILVREGGNRFSVIDGQQRLVSLSIIIATLRDLEQDPEWMRLLDALIVEPGDKLRGIRTEPRLALRERDAAFFREYVQEGNLEALFDMGDEDWTSNAQRNITLNTKATYDALDALSEDERHRFASYLVKSVTLVIVTTDDLDGAHRIFDVMNMRGLPLTPSDVFKAKAIAGMNAAAADAYAARWDDIMDPLGDDALHVEEFFSYLHMALTYRPDSGKLIQDFLDGVLQPYLAAGTATSFIDKVLAPYAVAWRMLDRPSDTVLPDKVKDLLESLNDYRNHEWKPVAMWALVHSFRNLGSPDISPFVAVGSHAARSAAATRLSLESHDTQRLEEILTALERVTGIDSLNRRSVLVRRGHAVTALRDLDKGYPVRLVHGLSIGADDRADALIRLHGEMQGNAELVRLLLIRANERKAGGRITRPRSLNALPIMPLNIERSASFSAWTQEQHDHWMYRLGNMALVQGGEDQLNRLTEFDRRRDRMLLRADSRRFPLTEQLKDFSECTPDMLQARQRETIRLIAEYWEIRYDDDHTDLTEDAQDKIARGVVRPARGSQRVTIKQVVTAGLLIPGETLVWERPRKGERWVSTVTADGRLRLEDGSEYATPTAAARAVGGRSAGLDVWKRTSNGEKLSDIWKTYRLQTK
ncbi:MAG: DUF262 domain-containing protein [Bifidobacterium scardovii]|uniref:GmrSD restriction endonuclease domain-containing protein n=1 Tax=Bifidobacterium scardovii TaxID=158787 RepID=UPI00066632BB|nr:DUF262 domain-containing protein [Bifidobacterium scardovii]MBS6948265.1 DUF262 domain-containing protein [Bifidobacterium scardovii]MDU3735646.1 DUF262 domain-containing protein [Bifidobacterium scardovii]MDU5296612.1 DUF262 domain-containing protein [Bifidobacterium scardovii]MDU5609994.1 DUF262 domain-containing protein [Bifidobacterium scardovii]MDU5886523.1 DUF262 domain-containing protein [Bifidobacterium scardovii]